MPFYLLERVSPVFYRIAFGPGLLLVGKGQPGLLLVGKGQPELI